MRFSTLVCWGFVAALTGCATHPIDGTPRSPCSGVCQIDVEADASGFRCHVTYPARNHEIDVSSADTVIKWKLPDGFMFCVSRRDGVWFGDDNDDQFYDAWATTKDDGEQDAKKAADCKKFFRIADKKEAHTSGKRYKYEMQFRHTNGKVCKQDPWVVNH